MDRKNKIILIYLLIFGVLLSCGFILFFHVSADNSDTLRQQLDSNMSLYVDNQGDKVFDEVKEYQFQKFDKKDLNNILTDSTYWIKIRLPIRNNINKIKDKWLMEIAKPHLESILYYQVDNKGSIISTGELGRKFPFHQRLYQHRNYIIPLASYEGRSTIYLAIHTKTYLQLPISLMEERNFFETTVKTEIANGAFYGALIIMILFNLFLGVSLKERSYLFYVCCLISYTLFQCVMDGYSYQFLWPNASSWDTIACPVFMNSSALSLLLFSRSFLGINKKLIRLNKMYNVSIVVATIALLFSFILPGNINVYIWSIICFGSIILSVISVFMKNEYTRSVIIYILSWEVVLSANILIILAGLNITKYHPYMMIYSKIGVITLMALFSLALTDRINQVENKIALEIEKRMLLNNLQEINRKIMGERDIFQVFEYLLTDFLNITGFEKGIAVLKTKKKYELEIYWNDTSERKTITFDRSQYHALMNNISDNRIMNLDRKFYECLLGDTNIATGKTISLTNRSKRRGFIVLYSTRFQQIRPVIEDMVMEYANQFALTIDNILLLSEITNAAQIDGLTQIYNRTHFFKHAKELFDIINKPYLLAVMMVDVDFFKHINDCYGHAVGDVVLKRIVEIMKDKLGMLGILGRYGGEEFVIIIPNQTQDIVRKIARDIKKAIQMTSIIIDNEDNIELSVTVSIGISYKGEHTKSIFVLTDEADKALYKAKHNGRNEIAEFL